MPRAKRTELNDDQRKSVLCHLLERRNAERKNGLEYGAINSAAEKFHTTTKSIQRIYQCIAFYLETGTLFWSRGSTI